MQIPLIESDIQDQMLFSNNPPANTKVKQIPSLVLTAIKRARERVRAEECHRKEDCVLIKTSILAVQVQLI